jgi:hypothetical protein
MKAPAITTQMEVAPGNVIQRVASNTPTTSRVTSPDAREQADASFNPPTYTNYSNVPYLEEKDEAENQHEQLQRDSSSPILETQSPPNNIFPQYPQEGSTSGLEEPRCDLLQNRPAVWLVKGKGLKVSSLAASVLLNDGVLTPKDLTLYVVSVLLQTLHNSAHADVNHRFHTAFRTTADEQGPSDPISGILTATHRTVVGVLGGVADYPITISRIATSDSANGKRHAASFALNGNKGVSRIVGTGLKAPMEYTMGISQGFHNVPKLWGDSMVREVEPVTGVKSGFKAAGKGFGLGLYDGISGLVTQPVKGAQEGGVTGFVGGFFKGIGGVACKPAAGERLPSFLPCFDGV